MIIYADRVLATCSWSIMSLFISCCSITLKKTNFYSDRGSTGAQGECTPKNLSQFSETPNKLVTIISTPITRCDSYCTLHGHIKGFQHAVLDKSATVVYESYSTADQYTVQKCVQFNSVYLLLIQHC